MRSFRIIAPIALGAALVAVAVVPTIGTSSSGAEPVVARTGPVAHAAGGGAAPLPLPSVVDVRVVRTEAALARAATAVDQGQPAQAVIELNSAVLNMQKAWTAARYVVRTAPPPPPAAAGGTRAHSSGGAVAVGATAAPEDTAFAVLNLQHEVVTTTMGLINGPDATLDPAIDSTITTAITARNAAINAIRKLAPPAPPAAGAGGARAHSSGGAVGSTWATVMPNVVPALDDEIQMATQVRNVVPTSTFDLGRVISRATATKNKVNLNWPPVPPAG